MARKKRDYKAEYAARKRNATRAGYKSVREYSRVRKEFNLPRGTAPVPRRIAERIQPNVSAPKVSRAQRLRNEARAWSRKHSHRHTSRYRPSMTDEEVEKYHHTFVEWIEGSRKEVGREKRRRIRDYLVPDHMDYDEWASKYQPV